MTYYRVRKEYDNFPKDPKTCDCDILRSAKEPNLLVLWCKICKRRN